MAERDLLAVDLGASSGRVMLGRWNGQRLELRELHRFPNGGVAVRGRLHWDVLGLWDQVRAGLAKAAAAGVRTPDSIAVDGWGVDFALLDEAGELLGNPYHYRDGRTTGMAEEVARVVSSERLWARTGIQQIPVNTLYQLVSMRRAQDPRLEVAGTLLLIPDLFHYWMTGRRQAEYTNATTTQLCDATSHGWATALLEEVGLPASILPPVVEPGTEVGRLAVDVAEALGLVRPIRVIAAATHDTASAVAAIPGLDERSAFISSGTWNLVGVELPAPILLDRARKLGFSNEGGVGGTIRFLRNVAGLWLVQECQRRWRLEGRSYEFAELASRAEQAPPFRALIDPDAAPFVQPDDMPATIRAYCGDRDQPVPRDEGEVVRCCLESLALKHRSVLDGLEEVTGRRLETIRIVGGGSRNRLLCQLTADACSRRVVAGPVEASALGNLVVQLITGGRLRDVAAGREAVGRSVHQQVYEPHPSAAWEAAHARWRQLLAS